MDDVKGENKDEKPPRMGGKETRKVESLGWLTESSVMPKKQRAIAGVGASSIIELRAELYRAQEDVRKTKEGGSDLETQRSRKKLGVPDFLSKKNPGVEERAARDKLHLKATNDGSASYAALEKKAELYEKLAKGELSDEEETEKYSVDFFRKGLLEDEFKNMDRERRGEIPGANSGKEATNTEPSSDHLSAGWSRDGIKGLSQEHKQLIREVNQETLEAREKASALKELRQLQADKKRQHLRQMFMKKQVEKLKAEAQKVPIEPSGLSSTATVKDL